MSWGNCHLFVPSVTYGSSGAHQNPPMVTARNLDGAEVKVCSSLPLLVWKKVLQQFQTGYDVVKPRHDTKLQFVCPKCHLGAPVPIRTPLWLWSQLEI